MNSNYDVGSRSVAIFHPNEETRDTLSSAMKDLGHQILCEGDDGRDLVNCVKENENINLIIAGDRLSTIDGVSALLEVSDYRNVPAIVVASQRSLEMVERALQDHVMAYLIEPVSAEEIKPTVYLVIRRFEQFEDLRNEVANLQDLLESRRHIERAKGVLMRKHDIDENEAYSRLRKSAMDQRIKIVDQAKRVLDEEIVASSEE